MAFAATPLLLESEATALVASTMRPKRTPLVVTFLGTNGGPPPIGPRFGISTALTVDDKTYVIDCGRGSLSQYMRAGLSLTGLSGIFVTHLHADHVVDLFSYPLLAGGAAGDSGFRTINAWGPGPAGVSSPFDNAPGPVPGLAEMTSLAAKAHIASASFFRAEGVTTGAGSDPASWLTVNEVMPPASAGAGPSNTAPAMDPFTVMEDADLRVSAILVPHGAVYPAYAYRFDTSHGSVVFSGDTAPSTNLVRIAEGADLLVHEVIDAAALEGLGLPAALVQHIKDVHTDIELIGEVANDAGVGALAINHLFPGDPDLMSQADWATRLKRSCKRGRFKGDQIVARDLLHFPVRRNG